MDKDKDLFSSSSSESFDESKHPRDNGGQFTSGASSKTPAEKTAKKQPAVNTPAEEKGDDEFKKADEFRYIKSHKNKKVQGHPAHVYAKSDEQAKYLQMTHSKFINDMAEANIELKNNPNPNDHNTAYVVPKSQIANLKDLGSVKKGWKLSDIDNDTILIYREKPFNKKR